MRLAAGLLPTPWGSLSASTEPLAAIGGGVQLLRARDGRQGKGTGKWRGTEGNGKEGDGRKGRGE